MTDNYKIKTEDDDVDREVTVKARKIAEALDEYLNDQDPNRGFDYVDEHTVPRTQGGYNHYAVDIRELYEMLEAPTMVSVDDPNDHEKRDFMINMASDELDGQTVVVVATKGDVKNYSEEKVRIYIVKSSLKSLAEKEAEKSDEFMSERKKMRQDEHNHYEPF